MTILMHLPGMQRVYFAPLNEGAGGGTEVGAAGSDTSNSSAGSPADAGSTQSKEAPGGVGSSDASAGDTSFDFIQDIFGGAEAPPNAAAPQPSAAPAEAKPAQPSAAPAQQQQPPAPNAETAAAPQQVPPAQQQAGDVPRFDPADPHSLARGLVEHEAAAIENLAQTVFKLSEAEATALETDFVGNLPKILAKVALFSQHQFLTQLGNIVPMMMSRSREQIAKHEENAAKFYAAWPNIDRQKHGNLVNELGVRYRKMFPNSNLDKMIQDLGPLVLTAIGAQPQPPAAAQPSGNGTSPPKPKGFVPAAPGTAVQISQVPTDPFGYMGPQPEG